MTLGLLMWVLGVTCPLLFRVFFPVSDLSVFLSCRQHCVPRDDGWGLLLGRPGRQGGEEAGPVAVYVCQRALCLPLLLRPRLRLLPLLPPALRVRVRALCVCVCVFFLPVSVLHTAGRIVKNLSLHMVLLYTGCPPGTLSWVSLWTQPGT